MAGDPRTRCVIELKDGEVEIEMLPDVAPKHVERIKALARAGEYDNVAFHRVIDGFMAQTGDVRTATWRTASTSAAPAPAARPAGPAGRVLQAAVRPRRGRHGAVAEPEQRQLAVLHHVQGRPFPERPVHGLGPGDEGHGACRQDHPRRAAGEAGPDDPGPRRRPTHDPPHFLALAAALGLAPRRLAQSADDVLVIEVDGSVQGTRRDRVAARPRAAACRPDQGAGPCRRLRRRGLPPGDRRLHGADRRRRLRQARRPSGRAGPAPAAPTCPTCRRSSPSEHFDKGTVGMARSMDPNSANSQFFIMFAPAPHLDGQYTIVGGWSPGRRSSTRSSAGRGQRRGVRPRLDGAGEGEGGWVTTSTGSRPRSRSARRRRCRRHRPRLLAAAVLATASLTSVRIARLVRRAGASARRRMAAAAPCSTGWPAAPARRRLCGRRRALPRPTPRPRPSR